MPSIELHFIDYVIFFLYMILILGLGVGLAVWKKKATTRDYFLAGDQLPWYAIGASILASNISTEHFIGMMGWAYVYGFVVAHFEWGAWLTWSIALWMFLPFYMRTRVFTIPEFIEKRFNRASRVLLSIASLVTYVTALEAGVLYAGAKMLDASFGLPLAWGVVILGVATGMYAIFGGLLSVVWTDFVQCLLFIFGGGMVTILGLREIGGLGQLMTDMPDKFYIYHLSHDKCPIAGYYICCIFVGAYYMSSNQFMMQRCLGARTQWDGRMGLLFSNYLKLLMPLIVVIPGIIAARLFPNLEDPDQAYPILVSKLLGPGMLGLLLAALAAAMMSTVSSALNSASTLLTMDLFAPWARLKDDDPRLVGYGKWFSTLLLVVGIVLGIGYSRLTDPVTGAPYPVFSLIMNIFFFIGPPLSIVFLAGILWARATGAAAVWTMVTGYFWALFSQYYVFTPYDSLPQWVRNVFLPTSALIDFKQWVDGTTLATDFNNFLYVATWNGAFSLIVMIVVSLLTKPKPREQIAHLLWTPSVMRIDADATGKGGSTRSLVFWWIGVMLLTAMLYAYFGWFQLTH